MIEIYPSVFVHSTKLKVLYGCYNSTNYKELELVTGIKNRYLILAMGIFIKAGLVKIDTNPSLRHKKGKHFIATYHGRKVIEYSYKMLEEEKKAKLSV